MIRWDTYLLDGTRRDYNKARDRKDELRADGWRVKIRKMVDGSFEIWKKHRDIIDHRNHGRRKGNRKHGRKVPKGIFV